MYAKPRRLTQKRMTLSDLEWSFHASCAISAVAELLVRLWCALDQIASYLSVFERTSYIHISYHITSITIAAKKLYSANSTNDHV